MRRLIALGLALAMSLTLIEAQTIEATKGQKIELNLPQAIELALNDNPSIKVASLEIERQKYVHDETRGGLMPSLSASGSYSYNILKPVMFMPEGTFGPGSPGGAMRIGYSHGFTGGFQLAIPLYMPTLYKAMQLNDKQMLQAVETSRQSKIALVNQVKKCYYGILLGESSLNVIKENIENIKLIVNNTQNSFDQGVVAEYDLITAQVQLSNMNPVLLTAENGLRISRLMLNMLLSLPLNTEVTVNDSLENYSTYSLEDSVNSYNLSTNSDLKLADIAREILQKQLEMQKATRIPTISAMAQYTVQTQNNDLRIGSYNWRGSALAGLQLSVPIFSGLSKVSKERQIKNSISQLNMQRDYLEQNVSVEAETALSNLVKARGQMEANSDAKIKARKAYKISKTRYDTGAGTIVELNTAQVAMLQAELNFTQSIYDYMSARADLDKVTGSLN
ncbi:MAG: TolC family protein [Mucinivorans sp.]